MRCHNDEGLMIPRALRVSTHGAWQAIAGRVSRPLEHTALPDRAVSCRTALRAVQAAGGAVAQKS